MQRLEYAPKILIIIDMQYDFIDGALGTPEALKALPEVVKLLANESYEQVYVTKDTHDEDYLETLEGKNLPVVHCVKGTPGWSVHKDIRMALIENTQIQQIIEKETFGSFDLADHIALNATMHGPALELHLCGVCTDICVLSNAAILRAKFPNLKIVIHETACAGVTPELHAKSIDILKSIQCEIV